MESYRYVNIFETKGLEYLLLISFLALFIVLVRYLMREHHRTETRSKPPWYRRRGKRGGE